MVRKTATLKQIPPEPRSYLETPIWDAEFAAPVR
jgi:hypothetical protein